MLAYWIFLLISGNGFALKRSIFLYLWNDEMPWMERYLLTSLASHQVLCAVLGAMLKKGYKANREHPEERWWVWSRSLIRSSWNHLVSDMNSKGDWGEDFIAVYNFLSLVASDRSRGNGRKVCQESIPNETCPTVVPSGTAAKDPRCGTRWVGVHFYSRVWLLWDNFDSYSITIQWMIIPC